MTVLSAAGTNRTHRLTRMRAPLLVGLGGLASAAVVRFRDPHAAGSYGHCPFHALLGLWCPGCGGLRAANDLTRFDPGAALGSNALAVALIVGTIAVFGRWARRRWTGYGSRPGQTAPLLPVSPRAAVIGFALIWVFTILRNTPWGAALAP